MIVLPPYIRYQGEIPPFSFPHPSDHSVVMAGDLGKLPGDDKMAPKRKGLRRLRKADRALQKQAQQHEEELPVGGKGRKDTMSTPDNSTAPTAVTPSAIGNGRRWGRRHWKVTDLSDLVQILIAAVREPTDEGSLDKVKNDEGAVVGDAAPVPEEVPVRGGGNSKAKDSVQAGKQKGKSAGGGGKGKQVAATTVNLEEDEGGSDEARREAEVRDWEERIQLALERETFVTTAHRAMVAARDAVVSQLVGRTQVGVRYEYEGR